MNNPFTPWRPKERTKLAKRLKIPSSYLSDILHRRKPAPLKLAKKIETALRYRRGGKLSRLDVLYPKESKNPLLF